MLPDYGDFDPMTEVLNMLRGGFGLKDAPRLWWTVFATSLRELTYSPLQAEGEIYVKRRLREIMRFLQEPGDDVKPLIKQEAYEATRRGALERKCFARACFDVAKEELADFPESRKHHKRQVGAKTKVGPLVITP